MRVRHPVYSHNFVPCPRESHSVSFHPCGIPTMLIPVQVTSLQCLCWCSINCTYLGILPATQQTAVYQTTAVPCLVYVLSTASYKRTWRDTFVLLAGHRTCDSQVVGSSLGTTALDNLLTRDGPNVRLGNMSVFDRTLAFVLRSPMTFTSYLPSQ